MYYVLCTIYCVLWNTMDFNGHIISCHGTACHSRQRPTRQKRQREVGVPRLQHLIWWCVLDSELKHIEAPKVWLNTKIYYTKFGSLASFIDCKLTALFPPGDTEPRGPCPARQRCALQRLWFMCGSAAGSASCSACDAQLCLNQVPSYPVTQLPINLHQWKWNLHQFTSFNLMVFAVCWIVPSTPLSHWGWNTRRLPCHSFAKNKARGSCIIDGIWFREGSYLLRLHWARRSVRFALHLAIGPI